MIPTSFFLHMQNHSFPSKFFLAETGSSVHHELPSIDATSNVTVAYETPVSNAPQEVEWAHIGISFIWMSVLHFPIGHVDKGCAYCTCITLSTCGVLCNSPPFRTCKHHCLWPLVFDHAQFWSLLSVAVYLFDCLTSLFDFSTAFP